MPGSLARRTRVVFRRAAYLAQMLRNTSLAPATLAARQAHTVRALVRHAALNVPFYRELYRAHDVHAESFETVRDLSSLPIVDKHLLRAAGVGARAVDAPVERVTIKTSGSTGEPFEFQIDHVYDQWRKAQYLRPYLSCGLRLTDKVLRLTAHATQRRPWYSRLGLLRERRVDLASDPAVIAATWRQLAPDVLQGYPSSLRSLAHHCLESGTPLVPAPRLVFTDSELLLPDTRALLGCAFGTPVNDIFGTFETDNIAYQCAARDGYHVATDCVLLEIVREGKPVPAGEEGEIVVTVLKNRTTPFIRYKLGDIGRLSTQRCSCRLPFPLLAVLNGRANDLIVYADGSRRGPLAISAQFSKLAAAVSHYQLRQLEIGRFELLIVPTSRFSDVGSEGIVNAIRPAIGNASIELRVVDMIPPDRSGKRRIFVSMLAVGRDG